METRHKRRAQAVQESKPDSKRSKRGHKEQPDLAHQTSVKTAAGARLTRAASKATGEGPLAAQADPERLLKHTHKRSSPKGKEESPAMEQRGAGGYPGELPDEDEFGRNASAMEGLLRRLGAGLGGVFAGAGSSRVRAIIAQLKDEGDEMTQLTGLTELCEYLSISTEESLMSFPTEQVVPLLVNLLGMEHNPDMMLLAARALTFLADVYPPACGSIIRHGAVPAFCARLLTIEFIDLAEQSLQALEKLSHDHPGSLLRNGGLVAVLSYLDFFPTGVQRTAVATAANICRGLTAEHADAVATAAPILIGLLQYQDAKLVDTACLALTRIAEAFSRSPAHLEMLCGFGLITSITQMVRVEESGSMTSQLSVSTFYGLIKLLATCAAGSHVVAESLLQAGISTTLRNLLATSALFNATGASPGNVLRSADQLGELVTLTAQLLPPIPDAAAAMLQDVPPSPSFAAPEGEKGEPKEREEAKAEPAARQQQKEGEETCQRTKLFRENPALLQSLTAELLPPLLKVYSSSVTPAVKRQCLSSIAKMLFFNQPATLRELTQDLPVSSFVAALLRARDATVAAFGMQMAEILMEKLPEVFRQYFLKEGVVHAMDQLAAEAAPAAASAGAQPGEEQAGASGESSGKRSTRSGGLRRSKSGGGSGAAGEGVAGPSATKTPAGDTLRHALASRARRFKARYFTDADGNALGCATEGVKALAAICQRLPDPAAVKDLLDALAGTGGAAVSTFELLSSGAVRALRDYLQGRDLAGQGASPLPLLQRLSQFAAVALPPGSGASPPMAVLVSKMLGALATSESFAVQINPIRAPAGGMYDFYGRGGGGGGLSRTLSGASSSLAAGLAALANPLKVRLARSSDDSTLRDFNGVVVIDALASMTQLEEFLWPRVCPSASAAAAAAAATRDDSRSRLAQPPGGAAAGAGAASVNNAAKARAGAGAGGALPPGATEGGPAPSPGAAAAAGGGGGSGGRPGSAGGSRPASKNRPIPQARRLTRAQARAAAEAEVAGNSLEEEQPGPAPGKEPQKGGGANTEDVDAVSEDAEDVVIGAGEEEDSEEDIHSDEEMEDAGYVEGEGYEDGEDDDIGVGSLAVHDMHLAEHEERGASPSGRGGGSRQSNRSQQHQQQQAGQAGAAPGQPAGPAAGQTYAQATGAGATGAGAGGEGARGAAQDAAGQGAGAAGHAGGQQQQQQSEPELAFYLGGKLLAPGTTIFQAVQRHLEAKGASRDVGSIWSEVHTLTYRPHAAAMRLKESEAATSIIAAGTAGELRRAKSVGGLAVESGHDHDDVGRSPLAGLLRPEQEAEGEELVAPQEALDVLAVLQVLESLNRLAPHLQSYLEGRLGGVRAAGAPQPGYVPRDQFASSKLAPKLAQQLKDVISICGGSLPSWCHPLVTGYKFLFPFETRRRFFYCTSFGLARALGYLQQVHAAEHGPGSAGERDARELRVGRLQRQKVRISRRHLLESALKVFEMYAGAKSQLEIEYFGEVGTGLGPTLEFYTLLSHELQRKSLGLWRHTQALGGGAAPDKARTTGAGGQGAKAAEREGQLRSADGPGPLAGELGAELNPNESVHSRDLVRAPQGLFPAPLPLAERGPGAKAVRYYGLLGRVMAKALQDGRLLDLPLSPVFYRLVLGGCVDLYDIHKFDAALGASVERLHAAYHAHAAAGRRGPLLVDGCPVEDLCLCFVLPGYPHVELAPNGAEVLVTKTNMRDYIDAVVDATLGAGVSTQVEAFREGFNQIFPLESLQYFYEDEIEAMLCGTGESWSVEQLQGSIKFDHGYTSQSTAVRHFLEVLAELDALDQRRFLRFVTGSPRLPPGGLAALQPRLTVVRKLATTAGDASGTSVPGSLPSLGAGSTPAGGRSLADGDLPSVMTCVNYIKLPPYSSKEVARERLLFAIREGQGSFDLS